jgi:hypothetical protein
MIPSGIEPATFRFVAQCLNHCATAVPHNKHTYIYCDLFYCCMFEGNFDVSFLKMARLCKKLCTYIIQGDQMFLCTCLLQYNHQVHRDLLIAL